MKTSEFRKLIREEVRKVLKEADESLDPNATYRVDISISRSEYDPGDVQKVAGEPLAVAKAVKQEAYDNMTDAGYDDGDAREFINAYKLDQDTYIIGTGEEDVTIVGRPRSKKYGAFWLDPTSDESEDLYYEMENDIEGAQEVSGMGGTVTSLGKVTTKKQSNKKSIEVGDIVHAMIGKMGDLKVVQIYPDKRAMAAAIVKLPKAQGDKARRWFDGANNKYDNGPFAQVVPVKGSNPGGFPKFLATTVLMKK